MSRAYLIRRSSKGFTFCENSFRSRVWEAHDRLTSPCSGIEATKLIFASPACDPASSFQPANRAADGQREGKNKYRTPRAQPLADPICTGSVTDTPHRFVGP